MFLSADQAIEQIPDNPLHPFDLVIALDPPALRGYNAAISK